MSKKKGLPVGAVIVFLVGLFAISSNDAALAASECLASPNRESGPGTHWHYRINQTTKERCWYLKKVGGESRPRPTGAANAKQSRGATHTASAARVAPVETASPAESESPIKAWFTATFSALSGSNATSAETREPPASEPPRKRRSSAERSESSRMARAQQRSSTSAATAEAAADKDVATATTERETEWQKALYEEFLEWRVRQLLFQ
jgi:hypothetical protein